MNASPEGDRPDSPTSGDEASRRDARRRMLRRSLGVATPTVLTLASNPVTACTCVAASSFASLATFNSRMPTGTTPCVGKTPSWWCSQYTWPGGCPSRSAKFKDIFGGSSYLGGTTTGFTDSTTLVQAMQATGRSNNPLAAAIVATYLNVASGKTSATILTTTGVVNLWKTLVASPYYYKPTPTSSIQWNAAQTLVWLNEMMA